MRDLAIAYHEWSQEITYDRNTYKFIKGKGKDYIRTRGGELYTPDEWISKAFEYVKEHDLGDLYIQVKEYVIHNHLWQKNNATEHALDCLLHESYKHWDDFNYQERMKI